MVRSVVILICPVSLLSICCRSGWLVTRRNNSSGATGWQARLSYYRDHLHCPDNLESIPTPRTTVASSAPIPLCCPAGLGSTKSHRSFRALLVSNEGRDKSELRGEMWKYELSRDWPPGSSLVLVTSHFSWLKLLQLRGLTNMLTKVKTWQIFHCFLIWVLSTV